MNAPKIRRFKLWLLTALVLLLVLALFAWWRLWQGGVTTGFANANLSKIESSDNFVSTSSGSGGADQRLAARSIVIICDDPHPLLARAGQSLRDKLAALPFVDTVTYLPPGRNLPPGGRLPDLLIHLSLPHIEEHSSPFSRTLVAHVAVDASTGLQNSSHSYFDDLTPPIISLNWTGNMEHQSTSIGDGVGADRYRLTGPHIGESIAKQLTESLTKLNKEHGPLPPLPPGLLGTYRPPSPDLSAIAQTTSPPILSGSGLLRHNETLWKFSDSRDPKLILEEVQKAIKSRGWSGTDLDLSSGAYLRMTKGSAVLTLYAQRDKEPSGNTSTQPTQRTYYIHYLDRFTHQEIDAALRSISNSDVNLLISFHRLLGPELQAQLIQQLEATPIASAQAFILLARHYQHSDPTKSAACLVKANVLTLVAADQAHFRGEIDAIAKELKLPTPLKMDLTPKLMVELQIPQITASTPLKTTAGLDQPVVGFMQDGKGQAYLVCAHVTPALESKQSPYDLALKIASPMGSSTSRMGGNKSPTTSWQATHSTGFNSIRVTVDAHERSPGRFDLTLKSEDTERTPSPHTD